MEHAIREVHVRQVDATTGRSSVRLCDMHIDLNMPHEVVERQGR